ncbi:MAG: hypothetical protein MSIBF_04340 [Candidatus Altiarchaeales archaeon IMC4]|nr:MAG: hypothetical protein MSIBF_04340 [Candidatus Altiarchaeales archaeon IMC4]
MQIRKSVLIDAEASEIFKALEDVKDFPKVVHDILDVEVAASGNTSKWTVKLGNDTVKWEITKKVIKPNKAIEFMQVGSGTSAIRALFILEGTGRYVRLICNVDYLLRKGTIAESAQKDLVFDTGKLLSGFFAAMLRGIRNEVESKYI